MRLITGGAFSGKTEFVVSEFGIHDIKDGADCVMSEIFTAKCIKNYHIFVKRLMEENIDPVEFTLKLCSENSDITVIMNETGCGIVPIEKSERLWREMCGKCGCIIADKSSVVVRVICGIGTYIKGVKI
ncbi:MAG: bifunctional adenosylcobinamide kinase/adenosylcobinamide-phosphate guanylyltransferase [Ruminococcus sp.]|nr:bifunctional adenosylcobinamide kinase/adenosylcobinamide-phosphate guanylyltransferase [Ruminococcus sp.]MDE7138097.1 bifunctional adenosylcobinamide kinase/adenosylcobinamide-phosphate guanylyltransferase [Ruminococcus sp.]